MEIKHITINTGHTHNSGRSEVADVVIETLRPLVNAKHGNVPGMKDATISVDLNVDKANATATFVVYSSVPGPMDPSVINIGVPRLALVSCCVAWSNGMPQKGEHEEKQHKLWNAICDSHERLLGSRPPVGSPPEPPWIATLVLPAAILVGHHIMMWLADFERCLAWTIIESER